MISEEQAIDILREHQRRHFQDHLLRAAVDLMAKLIKERREADGITGRALDQRESL